MTTPFICDSHEIQWARRELKVPAGNIISARTHFRLERARETGEAFIAGQPEDLRPWLTELLESTLGNAGRGSVRGRWSASPRTWDHIVRLNLE